MRSARSLNSQRPAIGDKRAAIIRAAIRVFAHNGYFNSKVADIASEAGVADGTVYLYFKSKEEILHSIFDRTVDEAVAEAKKLLETISDPREKLRQMALLHLERLGADRDLAVVFQVELPGHSHAHSDEPTTLVDVFSIIAQKHKRPDTLNYKHGGAWHSISSDEMLARVRLIAAGLHALGARRGDRVALLSDSRPEWT